MTTFLSILAMILGFGFVIFWHELGHFLGCRYAGIRVEQFAVGMAHAVVSYRKGIGLRLGSTQKEFDERVNAEYERREREGERFKERTAEPSVRERYDIARDLGIGETEYRLSWLPIGGYVKPTGQDDLRPAAQAAADDPRSFAAASVGHRMIMISAGVVMNVILAGILFFVLFRFVGFNAIAPRVGWVQSDSPAAVAGLRGGDELVALDGHPLREFTKVLMNVALLPSDRPVDLKFKRDGVEQTVQIQARKTSDNNGMLAMGIEPMPSLAAFARKDADKDRLAEWEAGKDRPTVMPGERIVRVGETPVGNDDFGLLSARVQSSFGQPVQITVRDDAKQSERVVELPTRLGRPFNGAPLPFLGLLPRTRLASVQPDSGAAGKLKPGDVILSIRRASDSKLERTPSTEAFQRIAKEAGASGDRLTFEVERDGAAVVVADVPATAKLPRGGVGLGVGFGEDFAAARIGDVRADSPAALAGVVPGATIVSVNQTPVATWGDVHRALLATPADAGVELVTKDDRGERTASIPLAKPDREALANLRYAADLDTLEASKTLLKTDSAFAAIGWGVGETRDLILQGYLTIQRVFGGSVPASNMSGPVGIFRAGTNFAERGTDWFLWFLALISANLAVVNFLPIPILDGWHFLGLVKEKITGKPLGERTQAIAQTIGLCLLLGLLLFVTFNDLTR